jgi:hypothetical protein
LQPAIAQAIQVGAAYLQKAGSFERVDLLLIELLKNLLEEGIGEAFG